MRARFAALTAAILVALCWIGPQGLTYLCSMDGQRHFACCCPPGEMAGDDRSATAERADCCDVERDPATAPAVADARWEHGGHPVLAEAPPGFEGHASRPRTRSVAPLARGPPLSSGPPKYVRDCRFLI